MKNQESREEVILGVVIDTIGRVLGTLSVGTHDAGYQQLLCWAQAFGVLRRAGVEGTGSYGAAAEKVMLLTLRAPQDQFWREMPILFQGTQRFGRRVANAQPGAPQCSQGQDSKPQSNLRFAGQAVDRTS